MKKFLLATFVDSCVFPPTVIIIEFYPHHHQFPFLYVASSLKVFSSYGFLADFTDLFPDCHPIH